jgi:D-alanine--poly(phosphoribitol) ligase subunit 1
MDGSMSTNLALPLYNHAQNHPERSALWVNQRDFTYGELADLAERIAGWLNQRSAGQAKLVGILASRSWEAYAGLLGACWAGATYVPLNPDWPEPRLLSVLENAALDALLVDERGLQKLSLPVLKHCPKHILAPGSREPSSLQSPSAGSLIAGFDTLPPHDHQHSPQTLDANNLAYIMFTSGTTGSPKGVVVSTGNVVSFLSAMQERYAFSPLDRVSQRHELSFDFSILDLFITWFSGASLHVVPAGQLAGPSRFIRDHQLTVWFSVPSTIAFMRDMKMLTPGAFPSIRYSAFCGEPLPASSVNAWQEACNHGVIDNIYGPTEATVACLGQLCSDPLVITKARGTIAIGTPFPSMDAAVVDSSLQFLPPGETGELALCGPQIAKGYFNDAHKTAERFPSIEGKVWYLTGDLAYQDADGTFHHLGRTDNQVKVLGHRVEIEDVEAHLRNVCGVDSVAAVAWPISNNSAEGIVAFVATSGLSAAEIRQNMQRRVPKYMVPSEIRFVQRLPMSANGKTDRKTLLAALSEGPL